MKLLNKYQHNYLLISAVIIYCAFIIVLFAGFSLDEISKNPSRLNSNLGFLPLIFSALILAPIFEEIAFRGFFTKNRTIQIVSIAGVPIFILLIKNYYVLIIAIPYVLLLLISIFKENLINKHVVFVFSAVVFALVHYKLEHFNNIITVIPILTQFALGLLLVWLVLNFNLKKAIIIHFANNFLLLVPLFISLQFPNQEVKTVQFNNYQLTWSKIPVLSGMKTFSKPNPFEISTTNTTPLDIYLVFDRENKPNLRNLEMFNKYKLSIKKLNKNAIKLDSTTVKNIMLEAELLIGD